MDSKKRKAEENGEPDINTDDVRALLEPFTKEQLMDLLEEAAIEHPDILEEIRKLADKDVAHRKLFVRGLGWDTTAEPVESVFSQYGVVEECVVIVDKKSGKSKGYGFVTFKHMDAAQRALKEPSKKIEGRMAVCQLATTGPVPQAQPSQGQASRKIYVGNVPHDLSADKLLSVFSQYGEIEEGPLGFDKKTGKSRGFALFIYKSADSVKRALEEPTKTIDGHQVSCKLAEKQKASSSDGLDLALAQAAGIVGPAPNLSYSALSQNSLSGLLPLNQGILSQHPLNSAFAAQGLLSSLNPNAGLASLNPSLHPSVAHQLALNSSLGSSLNSSLNTSLNSSLPTSYASLSQGGSQGLSQAFGQVSSSAGLGSYGLHGLGVYGSQVAGLGGAGGLGSSLYGMPSSSGDHLSAYQNSQLGQASGARAQSLSSYFTN